jgi:hypothetical protein
VNDAVDDGPGEGVLVEVEVGRSLAVGVWVFFSVGEATG